jgi:hypothetical protein
MKWRVRKMKNADLEDMFLRFKKENKIDTIELLRDFFGFDVEDAGFNDDGTELYAKERVTGIIYKHELSKPWDMSTCVYIG